MSDMPEWEYIIYRVEWVFKIGTIGDSEGRTWAKELTEERRFSTKEKAEAYRDSHPDLVPTQWGSWRTKSPYGLFAIVRQEVRADAPLKASDAMARRPEVADLMTQMHRVMWEGDAHSREIARAALAPFTTPRGSP